MLASRCVFAVLLASLLASCASSPKGDQNAASAELKPENGTVSEVKPSPDKQPLPICPQVAILRELDTFLRTKDGEAYDAREVKPEELVSGAKMTRVKGDCVYRKDGVDAKFKLAFVAAKGPLLQGLKAAFPYFVAVVDPSGNVLDKASYTVEIGFSSEKPTMAHEESLRVHIPLDPAARTSGASYQVLMGFQRAKGE